MEADVIKSYIRLSLDLQVANEVIRDLEKLTKQIPPLCPCRKKLVSDLDTARQIRRDIRSDINHMADTRIVLKWEAMK